MVKNTIIKSKINIIPEPFDVKLKEGSFILNQETEIISDLSLMRHTEFLKSLLFKETNLHLTLKSLSSRGNEENSIRLQIVKEEPIINSEGYVIDISKKGVLIKALTEAGIFYGIQTLQQLFNLVSDDLKGQKAEISIPCLTIIDYPRFKWRGFMLDEARHFFGKETVKKFLDILALLKLNVFHWHLTDDQGWRIEIKKYPRLIEIGSKRKGTMTTKRKKLDGIPVRGHYSQGELKEIINYAKERYITVIPEIDLPGHTTAFLAAYPELSCTGGPFEVSPYFGVHDDVLCVGKEETFEFVKNILKEVIEIFPSKIIHIGGDEVPKKRWKACSHCQERILKEGIKNEDDLQTYFTNILAEFLKAQDRTLMGWNEILNGNLDKEAIIHYWTHNFDKVLKYLREGGKAVMSEMSKTYLNYPHQAISLRDTYEYEPVPNNVEERYHKNVLGIEGPVWTEHIANSDKLEMQVFPRLIAIAETGWSFQIKKDFTQFKNKLGKFLKRPEFSYIHYTSLEHL